MLGETLCNLTNFQKSISISRATFVGMTTRDVTITRWSFQICVHPLPGAVGFGQFMLTSNLQTLIPIAWACFAWIIRCNMQQINQTCDITMCPDPPTQAWTTATVPRLDPNSERWRQRDGSRRKDLKRSINGPLVLDVVAIQLVAGGMMRGSWKSEDCSTFMPQVNAWSDRKKSFYNEGTRIWMPLGDASQ